MLSWPQIFVLWGQAGLHELEIAENLSLRDACYAPFSNGRRLAISILLVSD